MTTNSPMKREQVIFFVDVDDEVYRVVYDDDDDDDVDDTLYDYDYDDDGDDNQLAHEARPGELCKCRWASATPTD